ARCSGFFVGLAREVRRMEPPCRWIRETSSGRSSFVWDASPCMMWEKPSRSPTTRAPARAAVSAAAPITPLMPGAGPPPTTIPNIAIWAPFRCSGGSGSAILERGRYGTQEAFGTRGQLVHDGSRRLYGADLAHRLASIQRHRRNLARRLPRRARHAETRHRNPLAPRDLDLSRHVLRERARRFHTRTQ